MGTELASAHPRCVALLVVTNYWVQMGTCDPLRDYLRGMQFREVILSFADVEKMIGRALLKSAERPSGGRICKRQDTRRSRRS
jgi:hypothetical protein